MRIRHFRELKGWEQKELAAKLDVGQSTVATWEGGKNGPNPTQRKKLCEVFGITLDELYGIAPKKTDLNVQRIPVISWVHANKFEEIHDPYPVGTSDDYIYTTSKCKGIFALRVQNDCMEPEFREGDIIVVCPDVDVNNGDYVVVADRRNNEATFKQLKIYGDKKVLHPLNPKFQDIELDHKKQYHIVGRVVSKEKKY